MGAGLSDVVYNGWYDVVCDAVCSVVYDVCVATDWNIAQKLGCVCDVVFDVMSDGVCVMFDIVCDGVCCGGVVSMVKWLILCCFWILVMDGWTDEQTNIKLSVFGPINCLYFEPIQY